LKKENYFIDIIIAGLLGLLIGTILYLGFGINFEKSTTILGTCLGTVLGFIGAFILEERNYKNNKVEREKKLWLEQCAAILKSLEEIILKLKNMKDNEELIHVHFSEYYKDFDKKLKFIYSKIKLYYPYGMYLELKLLFEYLSNNAELLNSDEEGQRPINYRNTLIETVDCVYAIRDQIIEDARKL